MTTRRALLAVAAGTVAVGAPTTHGTAHPDAALLALCVHLEGMQREWQSLYDATSDQAELTTPADHAWNDYSNDVWPGIGLSDWNRVEPGDQGGELRLLPAITPEGLKAKARAVMALNSAASYCDCRNDAAQLWEAVVADAAGPDWQRMGDDARTTPLRPVAHAA